MGDGIAVLRGSGSELAAHFLDPFAGPQAGGIAGVVGGAGNVRPEVEGAKLLDEAGGVVAAVGAQRDGAGPVGMGLDHRQRREALGMPGLMFWADRASISPAFRSIGDTIYAAGSAFSTLGIAAAATGGLTRTGVVDCPIAGLAIAAPGRDTRLEPPIEDERWAIPLDPGTTQ